MSIKPSGPNSPRLEAPVSARVAKASPSTTEGPSAPSPSAAPRGRDVLDLSPAARAFVARADEEGGLSAERLLEIRQRVLDGAYDSVEIRDAVAAKLRRSGDLR